MDFPPPVRDDEKELNISENVDKKTDSKVGVGIGIITRGWVSIKWMMHMERMRGTYPIGMFWKYLVVEGRGWADARTEVVHKAKAMNFEYLFFIDDDVFIPEDALNRLLSSGKKIITGMYWTKTDPARPVIFKRMGDGPYDHFPLDELIEIGGAGLGCCLIHMSVFEKFDENNIPYFLENWIYKDEKGQNMKCPVGEDHYFYCKAKELGYKVWCDSGCLCDHYDYKTKRTFPSEDIVRKLTEQKLKQVGRMDIIEKHKKELGVDPTKKTIAFFNATANPFAGDELEKRGLGGSEGDVINLSRIFANKFGFNVHVFANCDTPGIYDNVRYHDIKSGRAEDIAAINADLFILSRNVDVLQRTDFRKMNAKKVCLWAHDLATDPIWKGFQDALPNIDKIFALTKWHKRNIIIEHKVPDAMFFIAWNGVDMGRFRERAKIKKIPGKCIYSSTPFRGLDILLEVWPKIKEKVPYAELHVFSSMKVYGPAYDDTKFQPLYDKAKSLSGVKYHGTIPQHKLANEFMEAELLTYPNTYDETSCITVFESQAAGTPIVTSAKAALNETVPDECGIKIEGNPYTDEYKSEFVDACIKLLTDKEHWQKMHDACLKHDYSWDTISNVWVKEFFPEEWKKFELNLQKQGLKPESCDKVTKSEDIPQEMPEEPLVNSPDYWDQTYEKDIARGWDRGDNEQHEIISGLIKDGDKIIDIGCGLGTLTRYIRKKFPGNEIWGTDLSHYALDFCREKDRTIFYANHPIENNDQFEQHYFDVGISSHVLEHYDDPKGIILKMRKIVKPDGKLIFIIPLNDEEWREHPRIWQMSDVHEMISQHFPNDETSVKRRLNMKRQYTDGRPFEEAMIIINLRGGN